MPESLFKKLVYLFGSFFSISLFVVGGGLAMIPVIENIFVRKHKILSHTDILDMVVMTQTVPGLIAVNCAVFVGNKVAGFLGAVIAVIALLIPSLVIILCIAYFGTTLNPKNIYILNAFMGIKACITALIFVTAYRIAKRTILSKFDLTIVLFLLVLAISQINAAYLMLGSLMLGAIYSLWQHKREKQGV